MVQEKPGPVKQIATFALILAIPADMAMKKARPSGAALRV